MSETAGPVPQRADLESLSPRRESNSSPSASVAGLALLHRQIGNKAAAALLQPPPLQRTPIQRAVLPDEQTWLRHLLQNRDSGVMSADVGLAEFTLDYLADTDRIDTIESCRGLVDAFEIALGGAIGFANTDACYLVSILEASQTNDALGSRLVALLQASVDPLLGLAVVSDIDPSRVRAVLQGNAQGGAACRALAARVGPVPGNLSDAQGLVNAIGTEMANPTTAGITASDATREANVENLVTPAAVHQARAAAAVAGGPAPTFVEAGFYDDLIMAVHQDMVFYFPDADAMNSRGSMDTSAGGHVEGIASEAKRRVDALFGAYGSAAAPALSFAAGNLQDQTTRPGDPYDLARWIVEDSGNAGITAVKDAHNAFADASANAIAGRVIANYSDTAVAGVAAAPADLDTTLGMAAAERVRQLRIIDRMWPGMAGGGVVKVRARVGADAGETRELYWGLFKTLIHEYLHTTAHATYNTWYRALTDNHQQIVYQEGFTDLFTRQTWQSVFPDEINANATFRQTIQGSTILDMAAVGGFPGHYPEMAEAQGLETMIGLPNMRAAYFRGQTALLGGGRLPR